jgi:hypothetical protein
MNGLRSGAMVLIAFVLASCGGGVPHNAASASAARSSATTSTEAASFARAKRATPDFGADSGSIGGRIGYPCECLPSMAIYAISTEGVRYYRVETVAWQQSYTMLGVAPGDYWVLTAVRGISAPTASEARTIAQVRFGAGYTKAVPCGLTVDCTDHSLLSVHVSPRASTTNVDPNDWYAPDPSAYPLVPQPIPSVQTVSSSPESFTTAEEAAAWFGTVTTVGREVRIAADCGLNEACFWLVSNRQGHMAAYFVATAGSNQDLVNCGLYLINVGSGWQTFNARCSAQPAFPAVGSSGHVTLLMGETGCVNVHDAPALTARVVACLPDGTTVMIDDGPYYAQPATSGPSYDYWWHIAGRGWMVHQYLR